jgi:hypothetical protein
MKNVVLLVAALLFAPTLAHAEFATPRDTGDVRPAPTTIKRTKIERGPSRVALVTTPRLTVDEVLTRINTVYMNGLQRCFRKSLAQDPSLGGKVTLAFRVDADGRAQSQLEMTSMFDDCLTKMMTHWRFSPPASESESSFRISLVLQAY